MVFLLLELYMAEMKFQRRHNNVITVDQINETGKIKKTNQKEDRPEQIKSILFATIGQIKS